MTKASIEKNICFQYLQFSKKHLKICGGWVHVYIYAHVFLYLPMCVCMHLCICLCVSICVYVCPCTCVRMCVCICVCICGLHLPLYMLQSVCVRAYVMSICLCIGTKVCVRAHDVLLPLYLCQSVYRSEKPSEVASLLLSWVSEIQVGSSDLLNDLADLQS